MSRRRSRKSEVEMKRRGTPREREVGKEGTNDSQSRPSAGHDVGRGDANEDGHVAGHFIPQRLANDDHLPPIDERNITGFVRRGRTLTSPEEKGIRQGDAAGTRVTGRDLPPIMTKWRTRPFLRSLSNNLGKS